MHIFNCDTDYALAHGGKWFTPPKNVAALRDMLSLYPANYASPGEAVLLLNPNLNISALPYYALTLEKNLELVTLSHPLHNYTPYPWGWNKSIRNTLANSGVDIRLMPSEESLVLLRLLSHRRTTIKMYHMMGIHSPLPVEIDNLKDAKKWCEQNPGGYVKAPWSSSGRGIFRALHGWRNDIKCRIQGILHRQGSIIAEIPWDKALDFATEWEVKANRSVEFMGYSIFKTDGKARYRENFHAPQTELTNIIYDTSQGKWGESWLKRQKNAISRIIAPFYTGPLGIDCLCTPNGDINPCVEVNLRLTMGRTAIINN